MELLFFIKNQDIYIMKVGMFTIKYLFIYKYLKADV